MLLRLGETLRALCLVAVLAAATVAAGLALASWRGVVRDDAGKPVSTATGKLSAITGDPLHRQDYGRRRVATDPAVR